jgi:hypothetical protein
MPRGKLGFAHVMAHLPLQTFRRRAACDDDLSRLSAR